MFKDTISAAMKIVAFVLLGSLAFVQGSDKKRISRLRCEEYSELLNNNTCAPDAYPFLGIIGYYINDEGETDWSCTGSLISDQFVLTVAHCLYNGPEMQAKYIRFGQPDFNVPNSNADTYTVSEIIRHPEYKVPRIYNDIALLKLDKSVKFTEYIHPVCLDTGEDLLQYNVAGFKTKESETRKELLYHEENLVASKEECKEEWQSSRRLKQGVDLEKQFCVREGPISCQVNSGGALLHKDEELPCMQNIAGMIQFGSTHCTGQTMLSIKVSEYVNWIENHVWL